MKRLGYVQLSLWLAAVCGAIWLTGCGGGIGGTGGPDTTDGFSLSGSSSASDGSALAGVRITVKNAQGIELVATESDEDGDFSVTGVPESAVIVEAQVGDETPSRAPVILKEDPDENVLSLRKRPGGLFDSNQGRQSDASSGISIVGNLTTRDHIVSPDSIPADPDQFIELALPALFQTVITLVDSLGEAHTVTIYFYQVAPRSYRVRLYAADSEIAGGTSDEAKPRMLGQEIPLNFDNAGMRSDGGDLFTSDTTLVINWLNGAEQSRVEVDLRQFTNLDGNSVIAAIHQF